MAYSDTHLKGARFGVVYVKGVLLCERKTEGAEPPGNASPYETLLEKSIHPPPGLKYKAMYGVFFQIEALFFSEKCMVSSNVLFGYKNHLLSSTFSA